MRKPKEDGVMAAVTSPKNLETRLVQLRDPDWNTRYAAARALVEMGEQSVDSLVLLLEEDDHYLRGQAAKCLGAIRDARAVAPLVRLLSDPNGAVRQEAVRALTFIGSDAVAPLMEQVAGGTPTTRRAAIQVLARLKDPSTRPALEAISKDMSEPPATRWEAKLAVNRLRERIRT